MAFTLAFVCVIVSSEGGRLPSTVASDWLIFLEGGGGGV